MSAYAHLCVRCKHVASDHRLIPDAPSIEGPYAYLRCDCQANQSDEWRPLTRAEFDQLEVS